MSSSWVSHFITHTKYSYHFGLFFFFLWRPLKQRERSNSALWNVTWAWRESSNLQPGNMHSHAPKFKFIFLNMNIYDWKGDSLLQIWTNFCQMLEKVHFRNNLKSDEYEVFLSGNKREWKWQWNKWVFSKNKSAYLRKCYPTGDCVLN